MNVESLKNFEIKNKKLQESKAWDRGKHQACKWKCEIIWRAGIKLPV